MLRTFVPVLKVKGLPKPAYVVIHGEAVKEPSGEFYLEWRSDGKRRQVPLDRTREPRSMPGG